MAGGQGKGGKHLLRQCSFLRLCGQLDGFGPGVGFKDDLLGSVEANVNHRNLVAKRHCSLWHACGAGRLKSPALRRVDHGLTLTLGVVDGRGALTFRLVHSGRSFAFAGEDHCLIAEGEGGE